MFQLAGQIFFGLIVGTLAKLVIPGKEEIGVIMATLIGLAGSAVGTLIGHFIFGSNRAAGWSLSIAGALVALFICRLVARARTGDQTTFKDQQLKTKN